MSDLMVWVTPILLWAVVALQIADYKKRKATSAEIQKLIDAYKGKPDFTLDNLKSLIKGKQK